MSERASFILFERESSPSAALALADGAIGVAGEAACTGAVHARRTRAMALALLGDHDASVSIVPDGQLIAATSFAVNRAVSLIRGGDPSGGARHVIRAVRVLPADYRQSATTRRAAQALDAAPVSAAGAPAVA